MLAATLNSDDTRRHPRRHVRACQALPADKATARLAQISRQKADDDNGHNYKVEGAVDKDERVGWVVRGGIPYPIIWRLS